MSTPFPGMDPYLERRTLWEEVHVQLITALARELNPLVRPRYRVAVEKRVYLAVMSDTEPTGRPDVLVLSDVTTPVPEGGPAFANSATANGNPLIAELPIPEEVIERYLEVRDVINGEVITSIEILSRVNKRDKEGRRAYTKKRQAVLKSQTHLVEIDLLRVGKPMEMNLSTKKLLDYHILISRSHQRPYAEVYRCSIRESIPPFPLPLRPGDVEPIVDLTQILHELYDILNFDLAIDYNTDADPPIQEKDVKWVDTLLRGKGVRS
ncbi:DUF4058 family protein [Chloroflexi bacterium TSY]|nr:DUF4058 family protein [Chloroflexi bacterium TSY]